mgnify:CR=1 FL=1
MKKIFALLALLALALCGCTAEAAPAMYIQPAQLSEEEEAVAKLLGADTDQHLFDVALDGTARRMCVTAYELVDGKWEPWIGGGGSGTALDEKAREGRLCFGFEDLRKDFREAAQFDGRGYTAVSWTGTEELEEPEGMGRTTSFLANRTEIVYEREIPIAIQINTTKNTVSSYDPEYFFEPERYAEHGYEHVYALTVTFSQEPLS